MSSWPTLLGARPLADWLDEPRAATPIPHGRGRWRLSLHRRVFAQTAVDWRSTLIAELTRARGRRLEQQINTPAQLVFTLNGDDPAARLVEELRTDVYAWRWDEETGRDWAVFRGPVTQSEDQLTEQSDTVNFTCHDYLAMYSRRVNTRTYNWGNTDQDIIFSNIMGFFGRESSSLVSFLPGWSLNLGAALANPDGTSRGALSGILRDRTYPAGAVALEEMQNLAAVQGAGAEVTAMDFDIVPLGAEQHGMQVTPFVDAVRYFYPHQGVTRSDPVLVYGATVSELTRTVTSSSYANYWRVIGNNGSEDPNAAQLFAERWNADANDVGRIPVGLWMGVDNAADVSVQATLNQKAQGDLNLYGLVQPTYAVTLRPGAYRWQHPNMGDVVPFRVRAGRLDVNTTVRVLGFNYSISDDGDELVELTVGRPAETLASLLTRADRDVNALTRR